MRVTFVITGVAREKGSAGHAIIFAHADRLLARGHDVRIVPTGPCYQPEWFDLRTPIVRVGQAPLGAAALRAARAAAAYRLGRRSAARARADLRQLTRALAERSGAPYTRAAALDRFRDGIPDADVTIATANQTVLPVVLYGSGAKLYFMQHHEVLFAPDDEYPDLAEAEAELSYRLPLDGHIANSSWLQARLRERYGLRSELCLNALRQEDYFPDGSPPEAPLTIVSYSGRGVRWKGLEEAAEAVRAVRQVVPDARWKVFGPAPLLAPDNEIAPFEALGNLAPEQLRRAYSTSHVALCPSWYESFPMYPLEAMACDCAVVSTELGAEDYVGDGRNCLTVPARDPAAMAAAVLSLWRDPALRERCRGGGRETAAAFTWERASGRFEQVLVAMRDAHLARQA